MSWKYSFPPLAKYSFIILSMCFSDEYVYEDKIDFQGKGNMRTFWLTGKSPSLPDLEDSSMVVVASVNNMLQPRIPSCLKLPSPTAPHKASENQNIFDLIQDIPLVRVSSLSRKH